MALHLLAEHIRTIRQHGEQAFPYEGCGILIGEIKAGDKIIHELWSVTNTWEQAENPLADGESSHRRFLIDPADFKRANDHAVGKGLGILGTYHSHPNHAAIPSEFDRQHAFPWGFSCVIVSVQNGKAEEVVSWVLDEQDQPQREPMQIVEKFVEKLQLPSIPALAG